ncbi:hypothetical protein [Archaeoglobus neptunius]|uniref:hypothetical protein n=1 Tax=Archaeoglobus neptunius TaxID=2798580 RepID=UPI0019281B63|nr:hypothetical protein [Archaeoglobus neptunius]
MYEEVVVSLEEVLSRNPDPEIFTQTLDMLDDLYGTVPDTLPVVLLASCVGYVIEKLGEGSYRVVSVRLEGDSLVFRLRKLCEETV